jgi:hypothetical protein
MQGGNQMCESIFSREILSYGAGAIFASTDLRPLKLLHLRVLGNEKQAPTGAIS